MAAVRAGIRAGVASGENLTGLEQYRPLLDANAVDIVQVGQRLGHHPLPAGGRRWRTATTCP